MTICQEHFCSVIKMFFIRNGFLGTLKLRQTDKQIPAVMNSIKLCYGHDAEQ